MNSKKIILAVIFLFVFPVFAHAYWVWSPEQGKFINSDGGEQNAAEEEYEYAMKLYKEKNLDNAIERLDEVIKKYHNSRIAPEAQYRLGTIYEEKEDFLKAFNAYKTLVETYPSSERFNEVIEREFRIGNVFLSGRKGKLMGMEILPSISKAADIFKHIVKYAPYSEFGDDAQYHLGLTYKKWGRYAESVEAFQNLIEQYPQSNLVSDARYQLAETSFNRSQTEFRDQRALDEASKEVDQFLSQHPDSEETERAEKLRQVIDEKNAEKNYRIGLYYEKQNYLESAIIYYTDTAARYPSTAYGAKAKDKINSFKEPVDYHNKKEGDLKNEIQVLDAKIKALGPENKDEKKRLEDKLAAFNKQQKNFDKEKKSSLELRQKDIRRREGELKEKSKNLEAKKKLMLKNPSEDYKRAIDRWEASLNEEKENLQHEKEQLLNWKSSLGIEEKHRNLDLFPFDNDRPTELDKIRQVEAKRLFKLNEEKQELLEEKENLYKHHEEIAAKLADSNVGGLLPGASTDTATEQQKTLEQMRSEIRSLENSIESKKKLYESNFGESGIRKIATSIDRSLDVINPFDHDKKIEEKNLQELLEHQMHLKEKIAAEQNMTETLSQAFDAQLAVEKQKKMLAKLDINEPTDVAKLRKEVKAMEKNIRNRYREIEDLHDAKNQMLDELDSIYRTDATSGYVKKTANVVGAPVGKSVWFFRSFLFGMPHREVELTKAVEKTTLEDPAIQQKAKALKEEIELKSILIDSKSRDISNLNKELEILKAKASIAGGYKFRSVLVDVPYAFIGEAVDSAKRLVPKQNREEMILGRLDKESKKLEALKQEMAVVESQIATKGGEVAEQKSETKSEGADKVELENEIADLVKALETKRQSYDGEKTRFDQKVAEAMASQGAGSAEDNKQFKKNLDEIERLRKELASVKQKLSQMIHKESEMESVEREILEKRIVEIDKAIQKVTSKALSQDLLTERSRIETRMTQIESRRDFLSKELERFEMAEPVNTASAQ